MHHVYASGIYQIRIPPKGTLYMGPEESLDYQNQIRDLMFIRGRFMEIMINIEEKMNYLIEKSILPRKSKLSNVIQEKLLHSRSLALPLKIDLVCEIIGTKKDLKEKDSDLLYNSLIDLIAERNKWAHGPISFMQKKVDGKLKMQSYLSYINSKGKFAEQELTDSYFDELNKKLNIIDERLLKVLVKRKLFSKDVLKKKSDKRSLK